jgi:hypothetical protein
MMDWRPIETAPKDQTRILVSKVGGDVRTASWASKAYGGGWWDDDFPLETSSRSRNPTHWMPLPEPPSG